MPHCPAAGEFAWEIKTLQLISHRNTFKWFVRPGKLNMTSWNQWDNLFVYFENEPVPSIHNNILWSVLWFFFFFFFVFLSEGLCHACQVCVSPNSLIAKPSVPSSDCKQTYTMASLPDKTTGGQHLFLKSALLVTYSMKCSGWYSVFKSEVQAFPRYKKKKR